MNKLKPINLTMHADELYKRLRSFGVSRLPDGKGGFFLEFNARGQRLSMHFKENDGRIEYVIVFFNKPADDKPYLDLCAVDNCIQEVTLLVQSMLN